MNKEMVKRAKTMGTGYWKKLCGDPAVQRLATDLENSEGSGKKGCR